MKLLHPADVARYRDGNKTDRADAKALLEASRNHALTPVPVKSVEQQAVLALHRIRQGYLRTRTARINALRGHLRELGHTIPVGARRVALDARAALANEACWNSSSNQLAGMRLAIWRTNRSSCSAVKKTIGSVPSSVSTPERTWSERTCRETTNVHPSPLKMELYARCPPTLSGYG